jgi:hypothetical protein
MKWMTILSCNSLRPANVDSMLNAQRFPANGDELHLLMGATTVTYSVPWLGIYYATQASHKLKSSQFSVRFPKECRSSSQNVI